MPLFAPSPYKVRSPLFPAYSSVRHFLRCLQGVPRSTVKQLVTGIAELTGTPQNQVDWSDPDTWIDQRLSGDLAALARSIWTRSHGQLNPRYLYGSYMFVGTYELMVEGADGRYVVTPNGQAFLDDDPAVIGELDDFEGVTFVLALLATRDRARRADLLPEWTEFLTKHSKYGSPSTIPTTLYDRLWNARDRGLVMRDGAWYALTEAGQRRVGRDRGEDEDARRTVLQAIRAYNTQQRKHLKERLHKMAPKRFEDLVGQLLDAMDYQDVRVTQISGDKGIDVVATAQFGITTVTEVVQVKRMKPNINRPVLDQLRGALVYHKAIRGTIITLSDFSPGCKEAAVFPGAAPITLINGEKLLDLLFEHEIGVRRDEVKLYEIDPDALGLSEVETAAGPGEEL